MPTLRRLFIGLLGLNLWLTVPITQAAEIAGVATIINGNIQQARQAAVKDALMRASLGAGVTVRGTTTIKNGRLIADQTQIKSNAVLGAPKILGERIERGQLHVAIQVEVDRKTSCNGHSPYQKRIAFTAFPMLSAGERRLTNTTDWEAYLPQRLMNQLGQQGDYQTLNYAHNTLFENPRLAPRLIRAGGRPDLNLTLVADRMGVQFLVAGVLHNYDDGGWSSFERLTFDLYLYDGRSGSLLHQARYSNQQPPRNQDWSKINDGRQQSVATLLSRAVNDIDQVLKCLPLTTHVVRVEGQEIYLDSGTASQIRAGDQFTLYQVENKILGRTRVTRETPNGNVTITQAFPRYSIGRVESDQLVSTRDVLREW